MGQMLMLNVLSIYNITLGSTLLYLTNLSHLITILFLKIQSSLSLRAYSHSQTENLVKE